MARSACTHSPLHQLYSLKMGNGWQKREGRTSDSTLFREVGMHCHCQLLILREEHTDLDGPPLAFVAGSKTVKAQYEVRGNVGLQFCQRCMKWMIARLQALLLFLSADTSTNAEHISIFLPWYALQVREREM